MSGRHEAAPLSGEVMAAVDRLCEQLRGTPAHQVAKDRLLAALRPLRKMEVSYYALTADAAEQALLDGAGTAGMRVQ